MSLKIALSKGRLLDETAELLQRAGWGIDGYNRKLRYYRLSSKMYPELEIKVFQERDIPIQVAVGNYDLGICGQDWVDELLVKYPSSAVVKIADLGYGEGALYAVAAYSSIATEAGTTRIVSEYPNLAESFAGQLRLRRFSVLPLWGAAEAYLPEDAEMVLLAARTTEEFTGYGLTPIAKVVDLRAYLIANRGSLKTKNMAHLLTSITDNLTPLYECPSSVNILKPIEAATGVVEIGGDTVRLALPDGHQQAHVCRILEQAGIRVEDYPSDGGNRRPPSNMEGVWIKVIRPQDMPSQVANNNFDLAITGRDWLAEHKYQFPSSPVTELLDLKYGKVKIVAVVAGEVPTADINGWRQICHRKQAVCRVASEYTNIADNYARSNRFGRYRIIPTWGATEAFLPEDADLLVENTETGGTIARHNLKIIDTLFESTACLIGGTRRISSPLKSDRMENIINKLRNAVEAC
jgi:ATP phosphoribosyltransferase